MSNDYFNKTGVPATSADLSSAAMRSEIAAIEVGFAKAAPLGGNGSNFVVINAGGTAQTSLTVAQALAQLGITADTKTTVASAASPDIWTGTGNLIDYTGTVTATSFAAAPQAGAKRMIVCAGAAVFTAGANLIIGGVASGSNLTCVANTLLDVVALTTTQFLLTIAATAPSVLTNSLAANVVLNNTGTYFTGPTVTQGTVGVFEATAKVTLSDLAGGASFNIKLSDGTTVIDSAVITSSGAGTGISATLNGVITNPAGNIRVDVKDLTSTSGLIIANGSGNAKDSTLTVKRIG